MLWDEKGWTQALHTSNVVPIGSPSQPHGLPAPKVSQPLHLQFCFVLFWNLLFLITSAIHSKAVCTEELLVQCHFSCVALAEEGRSEGHSRIPLAESLLLFTLDRRRFKTALFCLHLGENGQSVSGVLGMETRRKLGWIRTRNPQVPIPALPSSMLPHALKLLTPCALKLAGSSWLCAQKLRAWCNGLWMLLFTHWSGYVALEKEYSHCLNTLQWPSDIFINIGKHGLYTTTMHRLGFGYLETFFRNVCWDHLLIIFFAGCWLCILYTPSMHFFSFSFSFGLGFSIVIGFFPLSFYIHHQ